MCCFKGVEKNLKCPKGTLIHKNTTLPGIYCYLFEILLKTKFHKKIKSQNITDNSRTNILLKFGKTTTLHFLVIFFMKILLYPASRYYICNVVSIPIFDIETLSQKRAWSLKPVVRIC